MIGGGSGMPRPGEASLAHHAVLFLDELPEFPRNVLELLRRPLDERSVTIARANMTCGWPLGAPAFVERLEKETQRRLHALPAGRPRRQQEGVNCEAGVAAIETLSLESKIAIEGVAGTAGSPGISRPSRSLQTYGSPFR